MVDDEDAVAEALASLSAYQAGMEVEPARFTPPEVRPGPPRWERYRAPRFSRRMRVVLTCLIFGLPAFLVWAALAQLVTGAGAERAAGVVLLFPMVPALPLLIRAWRDLWGSSQR